MTFVALNEALIMEIIVLLILISLLVASGFLLAYLWANRSGQFDDEYTPSIRILFDDSPPSEAAGEKASPKSEVLPAAKTTSR